MTSGERKAAPGAPAPMTPERWRRVDEILQAALASEPADRARVVADACGDDDALRREIESLLGAHDRAGDDFLERPAVETLGGLPPLGERLADALAGRYAIERELAHGGMATVYLARDLRHDRRVAIKVLREELAAAVGAERFLREIRVMASLQHPHILPLFDSGGADRLLWYAMPYVTGETLRSRLAREGRLPVEVAVTIAREIAAALDYAHRQGVVHRDVKPENVLLEDGHALVTDFGIALALEQAGGERLTRTGIAIGTPQYMAPEQARGERAVDARTDVYALGAVLHEMLSGSPPFAAATPLGVVRRMLHDAPPALVASRPEVPPLLDAAVQRALAKRPGERFASAAAFAATLAVPSGGGALAPAAPRPEWGEPAGPGAPAPRMVSAKAAMMAAAAMLVLGLAGGWTLGRPGGLEDIVGRFGSPPEGRTVLPVLAAERAPLLVVDRAGREQRAIPASRPWTPRFSPDGRRVAYGAFGQGRGTSDVWVTELASGVTERITDDDADNNDPQWSPDGETLAWAADARGGKDLLARRIGDPVTRVLASRPGTQFASEWLRDGSALLVTEMTGSRGLDILVQPADGSPARGFATSRANETSARLSPDGRWVAYTSDESGSAEIWLDSWPQPSRRVRLSSGGGVHPVWRGDGRELFYWQGEELVALQLEPSTTGAPPAVRGRTVLFRAPYPSGFNTMYDVSPDGERFVISLSR